MYVDEFQLRKLTDKHVSMISWGLVPCYVAQMEQDLATFKQAYQDTYQDTFRGTKEEAKNYRAMLTRLIEQFEGQKKMALAIAAILEGEDEDV